MEQIQCLAAAAVTRVINGSSLDAQLAAVWRDEPALTAQQRGAVQDLVYGVLRHLGRLDAISAQLLQKPLADAPVRDLLRVALYQLGHTRVSAHAIVDHAVTACVRLGHPQARGLVNAVLRNYLRRRDDLDTAAASTDEGRYSYPSWWIVKLAADHPEHWRGMLEAGNLRPPLTLRVNRRRISRDAYLERLAQQDIAAQPVGDDGVIVTKPRPVAQLPGFADGLVSVQDAGAQLAAGLLDVSAGMRVLDACAAPGGKAAHLLELADIELLAADIDGERLQRIAENLQRLSLTAQLLQADAGEPGAWRDSGSFDRILADVPCTASGVVRRHPDIKWLRRPGDIAMLTKRQARILDTLWQLLRGGGKLLYATCSLFHEENGLQVERFLARHADARLMPLMLPADGIKQTKGQLLPDAAHDGFFYALLEKV